ncbi:MAG: nucleotidyltransferase domain-containing protein [Cyanobacteria bacterium J06581_3]
MNTTPKFRELQALGRVAFSSETLGAFCKKWQIAEVCVFGSVLRNDFQDDSSDLDILITFLPDDPWNLLDLVSMEQELAVLAERNVDLIEKKGIENSRNTIRKAEILESSQIIYSRASVYEPA